MLLALWVRGEKGQACFGCGDTDDCEGRCGHGSSPWYGQRWGWAWWVAADAFTDGWLFVSAGGAGKTAVRTWGQPSGHGQRWMCIHVLWRMRATDRRARPHWLPAGGLYAPGTRAPVLCPLGIGVLGGHGGGRRGSWDLCRCDGYMAARAQCAWSRTRVQELTLPSPRGVSDLLDPREGGNALQKQSTGMVRDQSVCGRTCVPGVRGGAMCAGRVAEHPRCPRWTWPVHRGMVGYTRPTPCIQSQGCLAACRVGAQCVEGTSFRATVSLTRAVYEPSMAPHE